MTWKLPKNVFIRLRCRRPILRGRSSLGAVFPALVAGMALFFTAPASAGQVAELVADLSPGETIFAPGSSAPFDFHTLGDQVVFFTEGDERPGDLWVTRGTPASTRPLVSFAGPALRQVGDLLYFLHSRSDLPFGLRDLWRTDGTLGGTFPLAPYFGRLGELDGSLLFLSNDSDLWRTDGTQEGTERLLKLPEIRGFVPFQGELLILREDSLWATDGTAAGTREILVEGGRLGDLVASGDKVFFVQEDSHLGSNQWKLWTLSSIGGEPVEVQFPAGLDVHPSRLLAGRAGFAYFYGTDESNSQELWITNGTAAETRQLSNLVDLRPFPPSDVPQLWFQGDTTWFLADDESFGDALWRVEGDPSTQVKVFPRCPDSSCFIRDEVHRLGDLFFFNGEQTGNFLSAWISDGSVGGERLAHELCSPTCTSPQFDATVLGDQILFSASSVQASGGVLSYLTDGTRAGTQLLVPRETGARRGIAGIAALPGGGWVFGLDTLDKGFEPWALERDAAVPLLLQDVNRQIAGPELMSLTAEGEDLIFTGTIPALEPQLLQEVYRLKAEGGPVPVTNLDISPRPVVHGVGDLTFVIPEEFADPLQLWSVGETVEGSTLVAELQDRPFGFISWQGEAVFMVSRGPGQGIWRSDGTAAGTGRLFDTAGQGLIYFSEPVLGPATDGLFYFLTINSDEDLELWASDGTVEGTSSRKELGSTFSLGPFGADLRLGEAASLGGITYLLVCDDRNQRLLRIPPAPGSVEVSGSAGRCNPSAPRNPVLALGDRLVFASGGDEEPAGIWSADPAQGEPVRLSPGLPPVTAWTEIVSLGNRALFVLGQEETGYELWTTDGTPGGTEIFWDLAPEFDSSHPRSLAPAGDVVYFVARDPGHGEELWVTDGTEAGTRLVHDIFPGAQSSSPEQLTVVGDRLYFTADDGLTGRELWVLPLDGGPACRASEEALCLQNDRFRVEARWRNFRDEEGTGQAVDLTQDTGYFWFFNEQNVETVLKVLDGRANNDHFWSFYGALSNVEYWLTVTDTETGLTRRYYNPLRNFASVGDTFSFGPQGASLRSSPDLLEASSSPLPEVILSQAAPGTAGACAPSSERLCVNGGRFAVEVDWQRPDGETGAGKAVDLTDDTGYFWFFRDTNVELILKVLDGTANNGHFWVFYGSLSNVDFDVTVTDTETGEVRTYLNRGREFASVGDTEAFSEL